MRRYRWALLTLPTRLRRARRDELLATLAEADTAERDGRASTREALALVAYGLRAQAARSVAPVAALLVLTALVAPQWMWALRMVEFADGGMPSRGPAAPHPVLMVALAVIALSMLPGRVRVLAGLLAPVAFVANLHGGWNDLSGALTIGAALAGIATALASVTSARMRAALLAAGSLVSVALLLHRQDLNDPGVRYADSVIADLGPAVALVLVAALLSSVAARRGAPQGL